ncbi:MAG: phosphoenolpyruvate carboxykinase (GTP) [Planctomycetales bacterium 4572_13]|nr:MAG: phosphoenolpyruvate carboxykinase (GTP) [Planctomycetales bacterium 4572_13]
MDILKNKLDPKNLEKLVAISNAKMHAFVAEAIELTNPASVCVFTDSAEDLAVIREKAKNGGGECVLATEGHTSHFDGPKDQARDKANTKYLLPEGMELGASLNSTDKASGLAEVQGFLKDSYAGKEMLVCFFCLGPTKSDFSISCVQITDSYYVAHSECLLYRPGYEQFKNVGENEEFFKFLHTQGKLNESGCSAETDKRRVYIDLVKNTVYSTNTQYAGNTVGLKKLALRLAIQKAAKEGWLAEHMFIMGINGPAGRKTYFAGAFPSACGKTSTAMLPGQTIVGDDIAYFRKKDGKMMTANVEQGIFGIIENVNADDDPIIFESLNNPGEVIFGNVLISDGKPYWMGMGADVTASGTNYQGDWNPSMTDVNPSHKNARYTIRLNALDNMDPELENPNGVETGGIIYGGRDSDTQVPVEQAFDWTEGIIAKGASIESETTAATLGAAGVRTFNIMANQDFVSIPLGQYIQNNLDFAKGVDSVPPIFSTNYFLKEDGEFLNGKLDKMVWLLWAELRVNGDVEAIKTPTGWIPKYEDLAPLFKEKLNKDYTQKEYIQQFTIRTANMLAKYDRVEAIYKEKVADTPKLVYDTFAAIRKRLKDLQAAKGDFVSPLDL